MKQVLAIATLAEGALSLEEKLALIRELEKQTAPLIPEACLENGPEVIKDEHQLMVQRHIKNLQNNGKWRPPDPAILAELQQRDEYSYSRATGQE